MDQLSNTNPSLRDRFVSGLASGLNRYAERKMRQMDRQRELEVFHRAGFRPEAAELLLNLREAAPDKFTDLLKNLGAGAYQEGARPLFGKEATPLVSQTFEDKELAEERKAQRKIRDEFLKKEESELLALEDVAKDAKIALKHLEENEDQMPWTITRLLGRKPEASQNAAQRRQEALYRRIATKSAIKNLAASGSRAGKSFLDVAEKEKAMLNQPIETQKELLKDIIQSYEDKLKEKSLVDQIKEENKGQYPLDLLDKLRQKKSSKMVEPIYKDGKLGAINPATGKWQELKKRG